MSYTLFYNTPGDPHLIAYAYPKAKRADGTQMDATEFTALLDFIWQNADRHPHYPECKFIRLERVAAEKRQTGEIDPEGVNAPVLDDLIAAFRGVAA